MADARAIACAGGELRSDPRSRMPHTGDDKLGWIMTAVLGIAGSFLARYVGVAMGWYLPGAPAGWLASIVGAIVLLVIYGLVKKKA